MKHTLHTLTSRFLGILWLVASVCMFVSCSDDTDETGGNFKLYYPDMTDIGPSMTGVKIPAPSFQGATPSEFEITAVTLNDESIENPCFVIDAETGEITINSTAETPVGEYKLTISCSVNGKYFTFKDIIKVTFLPRAPEGTVAEPNHILVMYSVVSDPNNITKLPTAQVKTAGEHVSITKYSIGTVTVNGEVLDKPEEMFEVSSSGEISILKSERFKRGVTYSISLKLETAATGDTPCIATDILAVEVASEPFSLEYPGYNVEEGWKMPNTSSDEGGSSFTSETPTFVGSTDGIKYWIEIDNEKGKDKILIDETTGVISVPQGHSFDIGDVFKISVFVANTYLPEGKKLEELQLTITKFYKPLDNFLFYNEQIIEQAEEYEINPNNWQEEGYEDLLFNLLGNWERLLSINSTTGVISITETQIIPTGEYDVPFRVTNGDGTYKEATFHLTVTENTTKLLWIKCGNNLGNNASKLEGEQYENQFRYTSEEIATGNITIPIKANLPNVTFELERGSIFDVSTNGLNTKVENNNFIITSPKGTPKGVFVYTLKGSTTDGQSLTVPIFIHCNNLGKGKNNKNEEGEYTIEYTPFVFHVNPRIGGTMEATCKMYKIESGSKFEVSQFQMDFRREFTYYNLQKSYSLIEGKLKSDKVNFLSHLWTECNMANNFGSKSPLSQYSKDTDIKLGWINDYDKLGNLPTIEKDKWVQNNIYANGFLKSEMCFDFNDPIDTKFPNFSNNSMNSHSPLMIWFDPDYYPVTE